MCSVEKHFRELQHVVGVAALRSVEVGHILLSLAVCEEVLGDAVATYAYGAVVGNIAPEVACRRGQSGVVACCQCCNTLEAYELRYLSVGMLTVEESAAVALTGALHAVHLIGVAVFLCDFEPFAVAKDMVGIGQHLVHASVFPSEDVLHVGV